MQEDGCAAAAGELPAEDFDPPSSAAMGEAASIEPVIEMNFLREVFKPSRKL
jgi:hypothetical protein